MAVRGSKLLDYGDDRPSGGRGRSRGRRSPLVDFYAEEVVGRPKRSYKEPCRSFRERVRRRDLLFVTLVRQGYTCRAIAEDTGLTIRAIRYGLERAEKYLADEHARRETCSTG